MLLDKNNYRVNTKCVFKLDFIYLVGKAIQTDLAR